MFYVALIFLQVYQQVLSEGRPLIDSLIASVTAEKSALENMKSERELMTILNRINGDIRAMLLIFSVQQPKQWNKLLYDSLQYILQVCREHQQQRAEQVAGTTKGKQRRGLSAQCSEEEETVEDDGKIFLNLNFERPYTVVYLATLQMHMYSSFLALGLKLSLSPCVCEWLWLNFSAAYMLI